MEHFNFVEVGQFENPPLKSPSLLRPLPHPHTHLHPHHPPSIEDSLIKPPSPHPQTPSPPGCGMGNIDCFTEVPWMFLPTHWCCLATLFGSPVVWLIYLHFECLHSSFYTVIESTCAPKREDKGVEAGVFVVIFRHGLLRWSRCLEW